MCSGVIVKELKVEESIMYWIDYIEKQVLFCKWRWRLGVQLQFDPGAKLKKEEEIFHD
jgi:hypothetical protein